MNKPGRNDPCCCGSGKKFKKCCLNKAPDYTELEADFALGQQRIAKYEASQSNELIRSTDTHTIKFIGRDSVGEEVYVWEPNQVCS